MPITDRYYANLYSKKILPLDVIKDRIFDNLVREMQDVFANEYTSDAALRTAWAVTPGSGNDKISILAAAAGRGTDGLGNTFRFNAADTRLQNVQFKNTAAAVYSVGVQRAMVPAAPGTQSCLELNGRIPRPEYRLYKDTVGRVGYPSAVTANMDGSLTFRLNSILVDGDTETYAGRKATVWLVQPVSAVDAVAIQRDLTIAYTSSQNVVSTSAGEALGQSGATTDPTKYLILVEGPTICRKTTRDLAAPIALTGTSLASAGTALIGVGTSFTTQLKGGDIISYQGQPRTVLRVVSNTSATLDAGFDNNIPALTATSAVTITGVFLLAEVTGNGPTAAVLSGQIDTSVQTLNVYSATQIAEILRLCVHDRLKIRVRADASDSNERQVEVQDSVGDTVWAIEEDGTNPKALAVDRTDDWGAHNTDFLRVLSGVLSSGGGQELHEYLGGVDISGGWAINAQWDESANTAAAGWTCIDDSVDAFRVALEVQTTYGRFALYHHAATASPWATSAWTSLGYIDKTGYWGYPSQKTFTRAIPASKYAADTYDGGTIIPQQITGAGGWWRQINNTISGKVTVPISEILQASILTSPADIEISKFRVIVDPGTGGTVTLELYKQVTDWVTPTVTQTQLGSTQTSSGAAIQALEVDISGGPVTIDDTTTVFARIVASVGSNDYTLLTPTGDNFIYDSLVTFRMRRSLFQ